MDKILRTVNICETSTAKMRCKLQANRFATGVIDEVLAEAQERSLIDDMRYAECLVRSALSSGKGLAKVEQELNALNINLNDVPAFREFSEDGEKDQREMALDVLRRHPTKAKNRYAAAYRKLIGKGYSGDIAAEAARIWCEECGCSECRAV